MLTLRTLLTSIVILLYCCSSNALAHPAKSTTLDSIQYFQVPHTQKLSLNDVLERFYSGTSITSERKFLSLGISNDITWVLLTITNHSQHSKARRLTVGKTWIDNINAYLLKGNTPVRSWKTGDHYHADNQLVAGLGYTINLILPSGKSRVLISAAALDPMTLPFQLQSPIEARNSDTFIHFSSALMYGMLGALIIFNFILHLTLRQPYPLFYCLYIICFIGVNISYNGYGFAWIYPDSTSIQSYATLVLMVLHAAAGITFVLSYLDVNKHLPIVYRLLIGYIVLGALTLAYYMGQLEHINATHFAFSYLSLSTVLMIITAILSLKKIDDAKYFLLSIMCSMTGLLITTFTVWGVLPYNYYTYHGAVWGVLC
ncbi:MAG: 7TMR-DISM family protein [Vibrio sp.]